MTGHVATALGLRPSVSREHWLVGATPIGFFRVTIWAFIALLVTSTAADADLWGHLRFGLDMLDTRALHTADPYSFTSDRPWINHEWLAELLMGVAYTWFGTAGLNLLKLSAIGAVALSLALVARQEQATPLARDLFVTIGVFAAYSRMQAVRPQLFSIVIFCAILVCLRQYDRGRRRALWFLPLCFAAWTNLHGGWIVGAGAVAVWSLGDMWQRRSIPSAAALAAIGVLSVIGTLVNPYGIGLWQFLGETVRPERADITDWKPLLQLPLGVLVFHAILPSIAVAALWRARREWFLSLRDGATIALLLAATFQVGRVDAFMQVALAILLAAPIIRLLNALDGNLRASFRRPSLIVGTFTAGLAIYACTLAASNVPAVRIDGYWIPDRTAALLLRDARPGTRILTWFDWGEYALWHLSPAGVRVSMDGRRETVYSSRVVSDHFGFYEGVPELVDYPDRINADLVWLPSHTPVVEPLIRHGWVKVLDTGRSVVLSRDGVSIPRTDTADADMRLFPWP